jgi:hypothetical protein
MIAVASLIANWRFTAAYLEMRRATHQMAARRVESAAALMASASTRVPESVMLKDAADYYRGIWLVVADKPAEAVPYLRSFWANHPDPNVEEMVFQAETGAAFNRHDYEGFLSMVQLHQARHSEDPMATAELASAYACKYVFTGDQSFKTQSLQALEQAKSLAGGNSEQLKEYEARIRCRLEIREILSLTEYTKRFPHGWKGGAQ